MPSRRKIQFFVSYNTWKPDFPHLRFRSRYNSRYEIQNYWFLPFTVATLVAMVFFFAVFAARAPAMGNCADRTWQFSQLMEGVLTACNPSHGSLSCVETSCGVVRVAGYSVVWDCDPTPIFSLKSTKRSAAAILGRSAPSLLFHGALRNILLSTGFSAVFPRIASNFVLVNITFELFFLRDKLNWP